MNIQKMVVAALVLGMVGVAEAKKIWVVNLIPTRGVPVRVPIDVTFNLKEREGTVATTYAFKDVEPNSMAGGLDIGSNQVVQFLQVISSLSGEVLCELKGDYSGDDRTVIVELDANRRGLWQTIIKCRLEDKSPCEIPGLNVLRIEPIKNLKCDKKPRFNPEVRAS